MLYVVRVLALLYASISYAKGNHRSVNYNNNSITKHCLLGNGADDCTSGFMSVERMRLLLDIDNTEGHIHTDRRQQITPDIRFTCDGMITKWIIAAQWQGGSMLYPELQVWRNIGNDTYQKINGTFIEPPEEDIDNDIYEYDNFTPIPFQSGDILGIFIPQTDSSRLRILSEDVNSPNNYYLSTSDTASVSPYNMIDIQTNPSVMIQGYHPMVTVEIGKNHYYYYTTLTLDYGCFPIS